MSTNRRRREFGGARIWLIALFLGAGLLGWWLYPHGNPGSPTNLAPKGTLLIGDSPTSSATLHWTQGGFVRALWGPSPGRAYRFVLCFYASRVAHDCSAGTGLVHTEEAESQTITRREVLRGGLADWSQRLNPRYEYDYPITLPETALDVPLMWTVGACSSAVNTSCTFAEPVTLALTARDLAVHRIDDDRTGADITITIEVRNDGRMDGESYLLNTVVWELLLRPGRDQPLTDVNHNLVMANDIVITAQGEEHPVADYINGTRPIADVRGIHRPGNVRRAFSRTVPNVPPPKAGSQPLLTGACDPPAGPDPCNRPPQAVDACEPAPCVVTAPRNPAIYAIYAIVNPGGVPWDFEMADNSSFRSDVYIPRLQ